MKRQHTCYDVMSSGNDPLWIVFIVRQVYHILAIRSCGTRGSIDYASKREEPSASHRRVKMLISRMTRFVDGIRMHCFGQARCTQWIIHGEIGAGAPILMLLDSTTDKSADFISWSRGLQDCVLYEYIRPTFLKQSRLS